MPLKKNRKINVAIVGGFSSIAKPLTQGFLSDSSYGKVVLIDSKNFGKKFTGVETEVVDLADPAEEEKILQILERYEIDVVIHSAFREAPARTAQLDHEIETQGTISLLSACSRKRIKKLIMMSSTLLYGAHPDNPQLISESHPLRADRKVQFFADKIEAEHLVEEFAKGNPSITVSILRFCPIVGIDGENIIIKLISNLWVPTIAGYDPPIQFVHQDDAVRAFNIFCTGDYPGIYNIVGHGFVPIKTAIRILGNISIPLLEPVFEILAGGMFTFYLSPVPREIAPYLKYPFLADGEKVSRIAGYRATYTLREVLEDLHRFWLRKFVER